MDNFDRDPRRKQELRTRPYMDAIYKDVFGNQIKIERFDKPGGHILDKEFSIDVKIIFPDGLTMHGQEKGLSNQYRNKKTLTVEYYQNQFTEEPGDWFKLSVQFYFCGYENDELAGFDSWVITDWPQIVIETQKGNVHWYHNNNNNGRAKASFTYTYYRKLPENCVIACSWKQIAEETISQQQLWDFTNG